MPFCADCGAQAVPGARFCVECGRPLTGSPGGEPPRWLAKPRITAAFVAVSLGVLIAGAVAILYLGHIVGQAERGAAQGEQASNLPPGHPKVELPKEARDLIANLAQAASTKPNDIATWERLGEAAGRAALFDASYYKTAADAFAHVLKLDPDNLMALRGIGNIDFDRNRYDEAIAAYEHYLHKRPNDPEVMIDLGTMYLYTGNPDQAIAQYKKALSIKPNLFEGYFNLGVAYRSQNDPAQAKSAFDSALKFAADDEARKRVKEMIAALGGAGGPAAAGGSSAAKPGAGENFQGAVERVLRAIAVAGPKVRSVEWPSEHTARVMMDNFPMDSMPPFAREHFLDDVKHGIDRAKAAHGVSAKVKVELVDVQTGRLMESVVE